MRFHDERRIRLYLFHAAVFALTTSNTALSQTSQPSMQDQVLNNLRHAPIGNHTLDALQMPEDYLRRVADRILRSSYEQQFRVVVPDGVTAATAPVRPPVVAELDGRSAPGRSPWPALVTTALGLCALAAVIIAVQAVRARR